MGSAWDANHVYFVVQWEDAGHTASTRRQKWSFGPGGFDPLQHAGATPGAPNALAANATGHVLHEPEDEDRVLLMFPIVDSEAVGIPVVASGGAGGPAHFVEAVTAGAADAALGAGIFHDGLVRVAEVKQALAGAGLPVNGQEDA